MADIKITEEVIQQVHKTGETVSEVLEKKYEGELADKRSKNEKFKGLSAVKIALIDKGIDGSSRLEKLFTTPTETDEFLFPAFLTDLVDTTIYNSDVMKYMVGSATGVDSTVLKTPTLDLLSDDNKKNIKTQRVEEGADIPMRTLKVGSKAVELYKRAIGLKQTYEAMRYLRIDLASRVFRATANDVVGQNISAITNTLEKGTLKELGTTAATNTVTADELYDACVKYALTFGYAPTTIVADEDMYKSIMKIVYNTNNKFGVNQRMSINVPQVGNMELSLIKATVAKDSTKNKALIYNKDMSIQRYVANGSNISEAQKNIVNQTKESVISEISGYGSLIESCGKLISG